MTSKNRVLLQEIGQKMREIDSNVWINYTFKEASEYNKVIISDMRQENEYLIAVQQGFIPIRVEADLETRIKRITLRDGEVPDLSRFNHEAEKGADKYKNEMHIINNNGSYYKLYKQIEELIGDLYGRF